ncbi:flavin-containing monooxygenase fmo gs-ox-like 5 [Quercus suber]|uniref:Flavin-containing monooxygenase n=1 Tax=Quercus suber TaxID=58331 RepID=A0AAW0KBC1_QUESU
MVPEKFSCISKTSLASSELVRFETEVVQVVKLVEEEESFKWKIKISAKDDNQTTGVVEEIFDVVVACSGHYTQSRFPQIPSFLVINEWAEKQMHSHNYRYPQPYQDQVYLKMVLYIFKMGALSLLTSFYTAQGTNIIFLYLKVETNVVTVDDNCVGPLYKHIFPPALALWLSFVGLPWKISGVLSNRFMLPSQEDMMEDVEAFYSSLEASSTPKPYTHCVGNNMVEYNNWLAGQCGGLIYMKNGEYQCVVPHSRAESPNPSLIAMNGKINT